MIIDPNRSILDGQDPITYVTPQMAADFYVMEISFEIEVVRILAAEPDSFWTKSVPPSGMLDKSLEMHLSLESAMPADYADFEPNPNSTVPKSTLDRLDAIQIAGLGMDSILEQHGGYKGMATHPRMKPLIERTRESPRLMQHMVYSSRYKGPYGRDYRMEAKRIRALTR